MDGKFGKFLGCNGYPKCKFTCSLEKEIQEKDISQPIIERSKELLGLAIEFVNKCGSIGTAMRCIEAVQQVTLVASEDQEPVEPIEVEVKHAEEEAPAVLPVPADNPD